MKNTLEAVVAGSIFDFAGFITTLPGSLSFGSSENASPMVKLIEEWAASRNLDIRGALVQNWQDVVNNGVSMSKITGKTIDRIIVDEIYEVNKLEHKPAFPTNEGNTYDGMELLDYFAAKAMVVILKNEFTEQMFSGEYNYIAEQSYTMAKAMIEERSGYVR